MGRIHLHARSQDESKRGQTKVAVLTTFGALIIALLSFAITGMLDNGIIPHSPWATESLTPMTDLIDAFPA